MKPIDTGARETSAPSEQAPMDRAHLTFAVVIVYAAFQL